MEFTVEFFTSASGRSPVRDFLLELKASDPDDFAGWPPGWRNCAIASVTASR
jgi:hypothetical protein